jgi:hypothetical protein
MQARILAPVHYFGFWLSGCLERDCRPGEERMELVHSGERQADGEMTKNENRSNLMAEHKTISCVHKY